MEEYDRRPIAAADLKTRPKIRKLREDAIDAVEKVYAKATDALDDGDEKGMSVAMAALEAAIAALR